MVYDAGGGGTTDPKQLLQRIASGVGVAPPASDATNNQLYNQLFPSSNKGTALSGTNIFTGWGTGYGAGEPRRPTPQFNSLDNLMNQFYQMTPTQMNALGRKLASAGILDSSQIGNPMATEQAYQAVLQQLAKMTAANNYVSLDDFLGSYMKQAGANKPSSYSTTETSVNLTDPQSARQLLIQTLQNSLGRNPSAAEYQAFLSSIHAAERENPTVTKRTMQLNNQTGSYDVSNTSTSGGVDPSAFAAEYGQNHNQAEHGAYQAATTYFDALRQAIGAVV